MQRHPDNRRHTHLARATTTLLLLLSAALTARADNTLRGKLKVDPRIATATSATPKTDTLTTAQRFDTLSSFARTDVRLSGYDKPLNSRKESLFVSNRLDRDITALKIRLVYKDTAGRTLHETEREIRADIPAGATRLVQFPSWDKQNSFFYVKGRRPRVANVTPFDVTCTVVHIVSPAKQQ